MITTIGSPSDATYSTQTCAGNSWISTVPIARASLGGTKVSRPGSRSLVGSEQGSGREAPMRQVLGVLASVVVVAWASSGGNDDSGIAEPAGATDAAEPWPPLTSDALLCCARDRSVP